MTITRTLCLSLLLAPLTAQQLPMPLAVHPFLAPIHTKEADALLGAYGSWASGDTYKVSFHDGFAFYPLLGADHADNLPLVWRTESVSVGEQSLIEPTVCDHAHTDWRYEYRYGAVVEAYDVQADGVEQTFVVTERPRAIGDLVVTGAVDTRLAATPVAAAHQALKFSDDQGRLRVTYGAATAVDADGRRLAIDTAFDGHRVRLTVPAGWLADATFPVTVDPLTVPTVYFAAASAPQLASMHKEDESATNNQLVLYSRQFTSQDADLYARLGPADFAGSSLVFADINGAWSTAYGDETFVGGADRWVVTYWLHTTGEDRLRFYFHDKGNMVLNSGRVDSSYNPAGEHVSFPAIGGNAHPTGGLEAVAVYRMDPIWGNSSTSVIHAVWVDAQLRTQLGRIVVEDGLDAEAPDINCQRGWADDGYVVTYQARSSAIDDYDVYARRVLLAPQFATTQRVMIGPDNLGDKARPVVQGWDDRYTVAMLQDVTPEVNGVHLGRNVLTVRLDWTNNAAAPTQQPYRVAGSSPTQELTHLALAFDGVTRSHWCLLYDAGSVSTANTVVKRLGGTGTVLEVGNLGAPRYHGACVFDVRTQRFAVVSCAGGATATVYAQLLEHDNAAFHQLYGTGCGGGAIGSDTTPYPGSLDYRVRLTGAPPGQLAVLFLSPTAGFVDLAPLGAPNCAGNLGSYDWSLVFVTDGSGACTFTAALPDAPLFLGDVYWQFAYSWPAAPTPWPVGATRGMRASVR